MSFLLANFSSGPLEFYRKNTSFDWKKMKIYIDSEEGVIFQNDLYKKFQSHPEFQKSSFPQTLEEKRQTASRQALAYASIVKSLSNTEISHVKREDIILRTMIQFDPSTAFKYPGTKRLFTSTLQNQGTERHHKFLEQAEKGEIHGCFSMTEIGHGSNIQAIRTISTYDNDGFVIHTPDFQAVKCWAGGLAEIATHAIVYAQLYINGLHYGLHGFVVPIRNPDTLLPYNGVILGDMGEKVGVNGADNGFLIFDNYHIPRINLLNKFADVTPAGNFTTSFANPKDVQGAILGALSVARVVVTAKCESYGTKALSIAVRYAAVRKQFGLGEEEMSVLEYQSVQYRLLPYLAAAYVVRFFGMYLDEITQKFLKDSKELDGKFLTDCGMEIHVVSSGSKSVSGWTFRDAIQECRETCGGHGYLKVSGIGDIRNDQDAANTYEGENNVLIQQVSNWLLKLWSKIENKDKISTPLESANFLSDFQEILKRKFEANSLEEVSRLDNIIKTYQWLICHLLQETKRKFETLKEKEGTFWARNNVQVFYCKSLSIAFIQHFFLQRMLVVIEEAPDVNIKSILVKLCSLYGLFSLEKFLVWLYGGAYIQDSRATNLVHEAILSLCSDVKNDAVALIDAIAPPDFVLNSVLGHSDGQVYQRLHSELLRSSYENSALKWSSETVKKFINFRSKM